MSGGALELCCGAAGVVPIGAAASVFAGGDVGAAVLDTVAGSGAEYAPGMGMGMGVGSGSLLAGFHDSVGSGCVVAGVAAVTLVPSVVLVLALVLPVPSPVPLAAAPAPPFVLLVVVAAGGGAMVSMVAVEFGTDTAAAAVVVTGLLPGAAPVDGGNISASMA